MKTIKEQLKNICVKRNIGMDDVTLQYCKYQDGFEVYYNESLDSTPWLVEIGFIKLK